MGPVAPAGPRSGACLTGLARAVLLAVMILAAGTVARAEGAPPAPGGDGQVHDLQVDGLTQRLLMVMPPTPRAVLVMLPGGAGNVGIGDGGTVKHGDNFLVRTRARFAALGFAVVIVDAAGTDNLRGRRATPAYGRLVAAIARFARARTGRPVFLLGTSQGAIAAVNGAAQGGAEGAAGDISGLVLTESVSRKGGSGETVFDADPAAVRAPTLIIANGDDACPVAPPSDAGRIAARLTGARAVKVVHITGGVAAGRACGSHSPHGYWGMDAEVVAIIAGWIDDQLRPSRP